MRKVIFFFIMFNDFLLIFHVMRSPRCLLTEFFFLSYNNYVFKYIILVLSGAQNEFITLEIWLISIFLRYL